jgi:hypothetical protein
VAWETVQKPKDKGGLGVINLRLQNDALLMKQPHKFYNHHDVPWVQMIWFRYYQDQSASCHHRGWLLQVEGYFKIE